MGHVGTKWKGGGVKLGMHDPAIEFGFIGTGARESSANLISFLSRYNSETGVSWREKNPEAHLFLYNSFSAIYLTCNSRN